MEIYIHEATGKMVNIYAPFGGFSRLDTTEIRTKAGVIAIEEDAQPVDYDPSFYDRREDWEATKRPYIIYAKKPEEQIKAVMLSRAKAQRQATVDLLKVTTASGKVFDGDEVSQDRIEKAIRVAELTGMTECEWVLANNVPTVVTLDELKEALVKAFQAMGAVWSEPYK